MGALLGPGKSMKAGFGMFMLGAGIGGFFAGLAAGDSAASYLNADGVAIKNIMVNLAEGLGAFAGKDLACTWCFIGDRRIVGCDRHGRTSRNWPWTSWCWYRRVLWGNRRNW